MEIYKLGFFIKIIILNSCLILANSQIYNMKGGYRFQNLISVKLPISNNTNRWYFLAKVQRNNYHTMYSVFWPKVKKLKIILAISQIWVFETYTPPFTLHISVNLPVLNMNYSFLTVENIPIVFLYQNYYLKFMLNIGKFTDI